MDKNNLSKQNLFGKRTIATIIFVLAVILFIPAFAYIFRLGIIDKIRSKMFVIRCDSGTQNIIFTGN